MDDAGEEHARETPLEVGGVAFGLTPGCRGHPVPPPGWRLLVRAAGEARGTVLDASGTTGVAGRAAVGAERVTVLEPSAAGLAAALRHADRGPALPEVRAGLPWDAPAASFDGVLLAPPADRGSARVRAELAAAARALRPGGTAWLLLDKDRGAKRYEKEAAATIGPGRVVAREGGWRLSRLERPADARVAPPPGDGDEEPWLGFETPAGPTVALPGTYAAGKLDPGTAVLLAVLEDEGVDPAGDRLLDLGTGWGPLARWAAVRGASVTAVDDDLAAVRSARRNVPAAEVLHSDLDGALPAGATFDRVLVNPPFHLGAGVRLGLAAAFLDAAARRCRRGGEAWIVANRALPYEARLEDAFREVRTVRTDAGFKVLRARARTSR